MAKLGKISKVTLQGSVLCYLHSMQPSRQLRWSKTTLPSQNPTILNDIIATLLQHGCDDITTLPESPLQRFVKGPALVAFPFAYLGAVYWIMRRLQRRQLDDEEGGGGGGAWRTAARDGDGDGDAARRRPVTTFDDVAGIDAPLRELSEVVAYLRDPAAFHAVGARPPRGILLHGPPGR